MDKVADQLLVYWLPAITSNQSEDSLDSSLNKNRQDSIGLSFNAYAQAPLT